jgi:hypothetical protein
MANSIVPFQLQAGMPALFGELFAQQGLVDDLSTGVGMGFPYCSIKGKNFHIIDGGESELQMTPGTNMPAQYLDVVLIRAARAISKTFYLQGYTDDAHEQPDCFSNDGIVPDPQSPAKQCESCALCPQNQWGSRASADFESKGKACQDARRVAFSTVDFIGEPMLLRVPPTSLKGLAEYGNTLAKKGAPYQSVVTRMFFDHTVAYPKLLFQAVRFLTDAEALELKAVLAETDLLDQITGQKPLGGGTGAAVGATAPISSPAPAQTAAPTPTPATPPPPSSRTVAAQQQAGYVPTGGMFDAPQPPVQTQQAPPAAPQPAASKGRRSRKAAASAQTANVVQMQPQGNGVVPDGAAHAGVTVVNGDVAEGLDSMLAGLPDVPNI